MQKHKTLWRTSPVLATCLLLSGCNTAVISGALNCSAMIGQTLRTDVDGAPLPDENQIGDWVAFGDAQTQKLDDANGRRRAVVETVDLCHAEQERLTRKPWWRLF